MTNLAELKASGKAKSFLRLLLLGDTKAGKTHYAMQAAEAGFNVLYLDGDVALQTLMEKQHGLSDAALTRVTYLNVRDRMDSSGNYRPFMAKFFVELSTSGVFTWNDTKGEVFSTREYERLVDENDAVTGGDEVLQIRPGKLDHNCIVIVDSWTTLVTSLQQWKAEDLGIDLFDMDKLERDMYTPTAHKATQFLSLLNGFPCHLVVIGHPREYQKRVPPPNSKGAVQEKDMKLEWIKMVPVSTSNPHALTMGKNFSDVAWIDISGMGERTIDMRASNDRVIGGHYDKKSPVKDFTINHLIQHIGGVLPSGPTDTSAWLTRYGPGQFQIAGSAKAPLVGSTPATATQVGGLSGFAGLKAKGVVK